MFSEKLILMISEKGLVAFVWLIYGRSDNWVDKQFEAFRIFNASYKQLSIITYDELSERAKGLFGLYN